MASRTTNTKPVPKTKLKLNDNDYVIVHRPSSELSHWWRTLQIFSFFLILVSGIAVCITLGSISNSFGEACIFNADVGLLYGTNLSNIKIQDIKVNHLALASDCDFYQFSPMAGACFAGILGAIFMQCGGGYLENFSRRTIDSSWMLVIPVIPIALIFFILALITMVNTISGLSYFCTNVIKNSHNSLNLTSCPQIFSLDYPFYPYYQYYDEPKNYNRPDLYLNYVLSQIAAVLNFVGWFLALSILVIRCSTHADFNVKTLPRKSSDSEFTTEMLMKSHGSYSVIPGSDDEGSLKCSTSSSDADTVFEDDPQQESMRMTKTAENIQRDKPKLKKVHYRNVASTSTSRFN